MEAKGADGRKKRLIRGQAPPVAAANKEAAHANVEFKLSLIHKFLNELAHSDGRSSNSASFEDYPYSPTAFNHWKSADHPRLESKEGKFFGNSPKTLRQYGEQLSPRINASVELLRKARHRSRHSPKAETIAASERRLAETKDLLDIANRSLASMLLEVHALKEEVSRLTGEIEGTVKQAQKDLAASHALLSSALEQNANLTDALKTASGLSLVKK